MDLVTSAFRSKYLKDYLNAKLDAALLMTVLALLSEIHASTLKTEVERIMVLKSYALLIMSHLQSC